MKKVIVACGNGVATSQTVAFRINRMLEKENITNVRVEAVNLRSLQRELHGALAYIDITNSHMDYGIPTVNGLAFLSGEHKEEAFQEHVLREKLPKQREGEHYEKSNRGLRKRSSYKSDSGIKGKSFAEGKKR